MIVCACSERRLSQSSEPCPCVDGYCARCLLCEAHCQFPPEPLLVRQYDSLCQAVADSIFRPVINAVRPESPKPGAATGRR
jgi:hypothetical protein